METVERVRIYVGGLQALGLEPFAKAIGHHFVEAEARRFEHRFVRIEDLAGRHVLGLVVVQERLDVLHQADRFRRRSHADHRAESPWKRNLYLYP